MTSLGTEVGWRKTHAVTDGQATLPPAPTGVAAGTTPPPPPYALAQRRPLLALPPNAAPH